VQNESLEGTQLARRGNDLVGLIFPEPLRSGQRLELRFVYGGAVLSDAGGGLLYVGARGSWYPHRGLSMSDFNLEFRYPANWTLVATGRRIAQEKLPRENKAGEMVARYVSERPIPLAGFNLGKYEKVSARAGSVVIDSYASASVENAFPRPDPVVVPRFDIRIPGRTRPALEPVAPPTPAQHAQVVADNSARAVQFFAERFGPYPYSSLALTQIPGRGSQGWPSLVYLSSFAYLSRQEQLQAKLAATERILFGSLVAPHETAHQWWGDLLSWKSYRDQWIVEALSNYCALLLLEPRAPADFRLMLEQYRHDLLAKDTEGRALHQAGPVTLGVRLSSSRFPQGYDAISYGRGTWLFHMLRTMLNDAAGQRGDRAAADEPFFRALRRLRAQFEGKEFSTADLQRAFEQELPASLQFEGRKSLDWFFQGWVNGTALPKIELKDVRFSQKVGASVVSGKIVQKDAPPELVTAAPIYAASSKGPIFLKRVFADGPETAFQLIVPAGSRKLLLDPYQSLLTRP
jgi:hypothetical protein